MIELHHTFNLKINYKFHLIGFEKSSCNTESSLTFENGRGKTSFNWLRIFQSLSGRAAHEWHTRKSSRTYQMWIYGPVQDVDDGLKNGLDEFKLVLLM